MLGTDGINQATLFTSAEPCVMCAGAAYGTGIGRIVYGLPEHRLFEFTGNNPENRHLRNLAVRSVRTDSTRFRSSADCSKMKQYNLMRAIGTRPPGRQLLR